MKHIAGWVPVIGLMWVIGSFSALASDSEPSAAGYVDNNVVIVLDASGSMNTKMESGGMTRMQAAKNAILRVLQQIPENTHVGILVFSARNVQVDWVYPIGPVDEARLTEAVNRPFPGGSTPLGRYIKKGADALLARRAAQFGYGTYRLIVVTDGEASDPNVVEAFIPDVLSRGIIVDAIGLDMEKDHTLATRVHSYRRADDPEALTLALESVFAEIGADQAADGTTEDAFAEIAGLPDEIASAMLTALASSGNHPIGSTPDAAPAKVSQTSQADRPVEATHTSSTSPGSTARDAGGKIAPTLIVLVIALLLIARKGLKRK